MSMVGHLRGLLRQLQKDPLAAEELEALKGIAAKTMGWLVLVEVVQIAAMYPSKYFFDGLADQRSWPYMLTVVGAFWLLNFAGSWFDRKMEEHRTYCFWRMWSFWWGFANRQALKLSFDWHVKHSTGEKESQLQKNVAKVQRLVDTAMFDTIPVILLIVLTTVFVVAIAWQFAVLAALTIGGYAWLFWRADKPNKQLREEFQSELRIIEQHGTDMSTNYEPIKHSRREEMIGLENWQDLQQFAERELGRTQRYLSYTFGQPLLIGAASAATFLVLATSFTGPGEVGTAVLIATWMGRVFSNFFRLENFQRSLQEGGEAFRELTALMTREPTVRQPVDPEWPERLRGAIEFRDVSFVYPNEGKQDAVRNISMAVPAGSMVALVGPSGAGKTTLASLLLRDYDPSSGQILVDGIDLRNLDLDRWLGESVGVVTQAPRLFDASIAYNIRLAKPSATQAELEEAAQLAGAMEFIDQLPDRFETRIGENGVRLSGGQKQRIAIARALVKRPAVLVLDEATSALDAISQHEVQRSFDNLQAEQGITKVVIAHRFMTIQAADLVVVMTNGAIAEMGSHAELKKRGTLYRKLRELEFSGQLIGD